MIPRPILADAHRHPLVEPLYLTDIGWLPEARYHFRSRPNGLFAPVSPVFSRLLSPGVGQHGTTKE